MVEVEQITSNKHGNMITSLPLHINILSLYNTPVLFCLSTWEVRDSSYLFTWRKVTSLRGLPGNAIKRKGINWKRYLDCNIFQLTCTATYWKLTWRKYLLDIDVICKPNCWIRT